MKKLIALPAILFVVFVCAQTKKSDTLSVTKHQLKIGAQTINYTATAGFMLMKDD